MLKVDESLAARALRLLGVTHRKARRRIVRLVDAGAEPVDRPISFTPRVREIMEDAFSGANWVPLVIETSLARDQPRPSLSPAPRLQPELSGAVRAGVVHTEDLLFALLAHGEGVAAHVLSGFGVDLDHFAVALQRVRFPHFTGWPGSASCWPPPPQTLT